MGGGVGGWEGGSSEPLLDPPLMDYHIHIDTISMELSILYCKGMVVKLYKIRYFCP